MHSAKLTDAIPNQIFNPDSQRLHIRSFIMRKADIISHSTNITSTLDRLAGIIWE